MKGTTTWWKILIKIIAVILILAILLVGGYVLYICLQYGRIKDFQNIQINNNQQEKVSLNQNYTITTYNIGFGAYSQDFSFFMDSGETLDGMKLQGTGSVAKDKETTIFDVDRDGYFTVTHFVLPTTSWIDTQLNSVNNLLENNLEIMKYDSNTITSIISSYFNDMGKYVTNNSETIKILSTYKSIPYQLTNKSNKFQYSKITNGAKSREYELPIDWLLETNLTIKCNLVKTPEIPLKGFIDITNFKLYMSDTGILNVSLNITKEQILEDKIGLYKGAVTENYVANQLLINDFPLYYWESSGEAEVDFLITTNDGVIPIEVKAADNTKSKSLKIYTEKYKPKYSIKISTKNFGFDKRNNIKSVPLYAVFCIKENTD